MGDPRADALRRGYAPVARAYREHLVDAHANAPTDREHSVDAHAPADREHLGDGCAPADRAADQASIERAFLDAFAARCRAVIPPAGRPGLILDVGCGPGQVARYLADRGATVEGIDLSPAMIAEAIASHPGIVFREGDLFALPYADGSAIGIVAYYAIVHLPPDELLAPLREWWRVLAPGGLAALAFHAGTGTVHVDELFGCATSLDFVLHRPEAVAAALVDAGFAIEDRLDREPTAEQPSRRTYLLARRLLRCHAVTDPRADTLRSGYATVARAYREQLGGELAQKPLDRAFLDAFAERCGGGAIVDVGCGPGHVAAYLAARGANVEGIDLSPAMIAEATATHPGIAFRAADMFALPHATGSVTGVVSLYAIVHLRTDELVAPFRELHRVLAAGGLAAVAFHAGTDTVHVDELFGCATSLDFMFHPPEAVAAALVEAGFAIEARLDREPYPGAEHPSRRTYLLARA